MKDIGASSAPGVSRGTSLFVTGTDTGVGKTWVSCRVATIARERGLRVAGLKAVESGCRVAADGSLSGEDDQALVAAAGSWQTAAERCLYRFAPPVAPGVAADDLGMQIDLGRVAGQVDDLRRRTDLVIIEGAGGWCVPMGGGRSMADLARLVSSEVVVVGRATLGTINHSILTARAVTADGFLVRAVVLSRRPEDPVETARRNAREIERATALRVVLSDDLSSAL